MQNSPSKLLQFPSRRLPSQPTRNSSRQSFFDAHPIGNIVRNLFFFSLLWVVLGVTIYAVFTFVAAAH